MNQNLRETSRLPGANLPPDAFTEINDTRPDDEPPAEVPETVLRRVEREGSNVIRVDGVAHETSSSVSIEADHEKESQVMGVPKCFEALLANLLVRKGIHDHHDEEHEVSRNTTRLCIMNLQRKLFPNFWYAEKKPSRSFHEALLIKLLRTGSLDIDKVDIVSSCVNHSPESH